MNTLFLGTPPLAVPYLDLLTHQTNVVGVVTTPDEPAGRGYSLKPSAVKEAALRQGLTLFQPVQLKDPLWIGQIEAVKPELGVVVAYGKILPREVLRIPSLGYLNVHFSLLPAYRGAAPIQRALMQGEKETGVTLFWLDEGMDTGPIFLQKSISVADSDHALSLREKLVNLGLTMLKEALERLAKGEIKRSPQSGKSSLAPAIRKEEFQIDWSQSATDLSNRVRGLEPLAYTFVIQDERKVRLRILKAVPVIPSARTNDPNGAIVNLESPVGFIVKCKQDFLKVIEVQPEGKRPMSAWDFWQGARLKVGEKLG